MRGRVLSRQAPRLETLAICCGDTMTGGVDEFRLRGLEFPAVRIIPSVERMPSVEVDIMELSRTAIFKVLRPVFIAASVLPVVGTWMDTNDAVFTWKSALLDALFVIVSVFSFLPKLNTVCRFDLMIIFAFLLHHSIWALCRVVESHDVCAVLGAQDIAFFVVRFVAVMTTTWLVTGHPWVVVFASMAAPIPSLKGAMPTYEAVWTHRHRIGAHVLCVSLIVALRCCSYRRMQRSVAEAAKAAAERTQDLELPRNPGMLVGRPAASALSAISAADLSDVALQVMLVDGTVVDTLSTKQVNSFTMGQLKRRLEISQLGKGALHLSFVHGAGPVWNTSSNEGADQSLKEWLQQRAPEGGTEGAPHPFVMTCVRVVDPNWAAGDLESATCSTEVAPATSFGVVWTVLSHRSEEVFANPH